MEFQGAIVKIKLLYTIVGFTYPLQASIQQQAHCCVLVIFSVSVVIEEEHTGQTMA